MDWDLAIKRNSEALKGIIAALFAMLGLEGEAGVGRIPQVLHRAVLRVLRPAESAVRRLIVIAARGVVVKLKLPAARPISSPKPKPKPTRPIGKGRASPPSFQLFDPRKRFARLCVSPRFKWNPPRIHIFPYDTLVPARPLAAAPAPPPDGLVNSEPLTRRLQALKLALDDLPRQAKRLVRWQERRKAAPDHKFLSSLRPGRPPGYRRKPIHEVDEVLVECDGLAWEAMKPDTS